MLLRRTLPSSSTRTRVGIAAGVAVAAVILLLPLPDGMSEAGRRTGAVAAVMALWWISEAIPIAATALLPVFAFPLLGISSTRDACAPYADPVNLFSGLDVLGIAVITLAFYFIGIPVFGIATAGAPSWVH
jgi:sodium-dependent dicarboxylate transporter 2/3/5